MKKNPLKKIYFPVSCIPFRSELFNQHDYRHQNNEMSKWHLSQVFGGDKPPQEVDEGF